MRPDSEQAADEEDRSSIDQQPNRLALGNRLLRCPSVEIDRYPLSSNPECHTDNNERKNNLHDLPDDVLGSIRRTDSRAIKREPTRPQNGSHDEREDGGRCQGLCTARFDANDQNRRASGAGGELMIVSRVDAGGVECEETYHRWAFMCGLTDLHFCCVSRRHSTRSVQPGC